MKESISKHILVSGSGINEPVVEVSREVAEYDHGVKVVHRPVRRGGGRGSRLFGIFLFSEFVGGLLEVAVVTGTTLVGKIPTLDVGIREAGRPLIVILRGLAAFVTLSSRLRDSKCLRSGHRSRLFCRYILERLLDGRPGIGPTICEVSSLRSPHYRQGGENLTHEGNVANGERSPLEVVLVISGLFEVDIDVLFVVKHEEINLRA